MTGGVGQSEAIVGDPRRGVMPISTWLSRLSGRLNWTDVWTGAASETSAIATLEPIQEVPVTDTSAFGPESAALEHKLTGRNGHWSLGVADAWSLLSRDAAGSA
jgi:hypothetical protein